MHYCHLELSDSYIYWATLFGKYNVSNFLFIQGIPCNELLLTESSPFSSAAPVFSPLSSGPTDTRALHLG